MKRKKITSLLLAGIMASSAIFSGGVVATNAAVNSSADSTQGDPVTTEGSQACQVDASIASKFAVTVPKKITLAGATKSGSYNVTCKGDIAGNESVNVVPDATFAMSQTGKANVQAAVTQEKTVFRGSDYTGDLGNAVKMGSLAAGESTGTPLTGSIVAPDLSAGAWNGAFNFTIGLKEVYDPVTLTKDNLSNYVDADTGEAIATSGDVVIPAVVKDKDTGKKYQVTGLNGSFMGGLFGKAVTSVTIPGSVTSIGDYAFSDCSGLTSIDIPDSVTNIEYGAFSRCSGLTSIDIPDSVTSIGSGAFNGCSGLTSITVNPNNKVYDSREDCNAIIETTTNKLVRGCNNTIIPGSVTSIGDNAFNNCSGFTSINIPDSVTSIEHGAFSDCSGLTTITIPDGVTSIETGVFDCCRNLTSIKIPATVTSIGQNAFRDCDSLTSITIPDDITNIKYFAFQSCDNLSSVIYKGQIYTSKSALSQVFEEKNVSCGYNSFELTALAD